MDTLQIKNEKDDLELDLKMEPELTVVNDDSLLGAELLIDPSKNNSGNSSSSNNNISNNTVENEDINLFKNNDKVDDIGSDPLMKTIDTNDNNQPSGYVPIHMMSQSDIKNEKIDLIYKFKKLENQGIDTTMNYNMNSGLDEMRNEYIKLKKQRELENSVKFQRKMLMAIITAIEFLNGRFDPFDLKLDGWSEQLNENLDDYDEIFGELHDKYKSKAKMAPELKLLFQLGGSAVMLHMTNTMFKSSVPGMDDIMRQNPELMQQFTQAAVNTMGQNNPGFGNFMSGVMGGGPPMTGGPPPMPIPPRVASNMNGSRPDVNVARGNPVKSKRPEMKGPSGDVNSLLAGLKTKNVNIKQKDSSSTVSISELKEMNLGIDQPKKSRRKKSERNTVSLQL